MLCMPSAVVLTTSRTDWSDRFPGSLGEMDPSQGLPRGPRAAPARRDGSGRGGLLEQNHATLLLQEEALVLLQRAWSTDPVFLALKDTVQRFTIPRLVFDDLISGMEDDLYQNRYRTFDDLYVYCYRGQRGWS